MSSLVSTFKGSQRSAVDSTDEFLPQLETHPYKGMMAMSFLVPRVPVALSIRQKKAFCMKRKSCQDVSLWRLSCLIENFN